MATSAFKSTTKRTPIGNDKSSSSAHRRSRSLSRFSRPIPPDDFSDDSTAPSRGKFVNMDRGSGVPDISLDDLAIQLLSLGDRGRSGFRSGDVSHEERVAGGSLRRGRSVSRQGSESKNNSKSYSRGGGGGKVNSDGSNSRRRRSVSVVRYEIGDSEVNKLLLILNSNLHFLCGNLLMILLKERKLAF